MSDENIVLITNKEDDRVEPMVTEDKGNDEESNSEEHGHARDQVNKVMDFLSNGGFTSVQTWS